MTITTLASIVTLALAGLVPAGCHTAKTAAAKTTPTAPAQAAAATPAAPQIFMNGTNCILGELNLTNHADTWVKISPTKQCLFTTKMIDSRNAQITLALESKNAKSKTPDLAVTQIVTKDGTPFEVALGDCSLSFTPHISE